MTTPRWALPAGLAGGVFGAHLLFFHEVTAVWLAASLLCLAAWRRSSPAVPLYAALAIGLAWGEQALESRRADRLDASLTGSRVTVTGTVDGLPEPFGDYTRFRFRPNAGSRFEAAPERLPSRILAYWYRDPPELAPGETWHLELSLKPPWAEVNFHGADRERWYFAEGIGALATVHAGEPGIGEPKVGEPKAGEPQAGEAGAEEHVAAGLRGPPWHRWRHAVRTRLATLVPDPERRGILQALAIADRSLLARADREALVATGTAHLLAISGLHVGLAALWGFWLGRLLLLAVPARRGGARAYPWCLVAGAATAAGYAALAGFGTSTVRALVMLSVALLALLSRRQVHAGRAWLLALALVLVLDPLAPLRAGFWLSFAAVAVLVVLFAPRRGDRPGFWRGLLLAQAGIMLVMLPLGAWWFQLASPAGLVGNLVAIPWVSFLVVPLTLLGLALLPTGDLLAGPVLELAGATARWLADGLEWLARVPGAQITLPHPTLATAALATAGSLMWLLPRGVPSRRLGAVLMLPLLLTAAPPPAGGLRLEVLDAGQGSALLLTADERLLLYDSGPGDGRDFDRVGPVIVPAIRQAGRAAPDRIVISHGDLDHAGGLPALQTRYPGTPVFARLPKPPPGVELCSDRLAWAWDDTRFRTLHPSPYLPYIGNDTSCVISVTRGRASVLLTGDISHVVERRLAKRGLEPHAVLLAPHHGSASSSSPELLAAVRPGVAVATAGLGNRFGFPRPEVRDRYWAAGAPLWSTSDCGGLRLDLDGDGTVTALSARRLRAAPWRWPAGPDCP